MAATGSGHDLNQPHWLVFRPTLFCCWIAAAVQPMHLLASAAISGTHPAQNSRVP
jgi:hypothetical protein